MNVYFACTGKKEPVYLIQAGFKNILCSYHYYKNDTGTFQKIKQLGAQLFMDSGAFSALNAGAEINIDAYSEFLIKNKPMFYVSLDVINDAEQTCKNWEYMNSKYKLNSIPTFHMKESLDYLKYYCQSSDYIALGGMVDADNVEGWLDNVWIYLLENHPHIKVHGFGMTITDLIYKYPWTSFDSSSFKSGKRYARVPQFNGKKLYTITLDKFRLNIAEKEGHNQIFLEDKRCQELSDIEGAQAYSQLVRYLDAFERRCLFKNQLTMFS